MSGPTIFIELSDLWIPDYQQRCVLEESQNLNHTTKHQFQLILATRYYAVSVCQFACHVLAMYSTLLKQVYTTLFHQTCGSRK